MARKEPALEARRQEEDRVWTERDHDQEQLSLQKKVKLQRSSLQEKRKIEEDLEKLLEQAARSAREKEKLAKGSQAHGNAAEAWLRSISKVAKMAREQEAWLMKKKTAFFELADELEALQRRLDALHSRRTAAAHAVAEEVSGLIGEVGEDLRGMQDLIAHLQTLEPGGDFPHQDGATPLQRFSVEALDSEKGTEKKKKKIRSPERSPSRRLRGEERRG